MTPASETGDRPRCFVTRRLPGDALDRLREVCDVDVWQERTPPPPEVLRDSVSDAQALLCLLTDRIDAELLDAAPALRVIANYAVGFDNIDLAAARSRGIAVGNTPGVLTEATADLTMALLLALARRLPEAADNVREGDWLTWEPAAFLGRSMSGATLGIIGFGRIGQAVAERARGFGMNVLSMGTNGPETLEDVLSQSDFVSLHCPLLPETRNLINARTLALMKPSAYLINTARGPIVNQVDLAAALKDGTIAGAALDVTTPEPLPADDPLLQSPNLIVVPHIASATVEARSAMADIAVGNVIAGVAGKPLPHPAPQG